MGGTGQTLDDPARLAAIEATGLMDSPEPEAMQRLSRLVSHLLRVPVALVSFVDEDRQFFVGATGFDVEPFASDRQTPLSHSFCQHVVTSGSELAVEDSRQDERFDGNRGVDELGITAYLGVPLRSDDGHLLGSLCAIDSEPRAWSPEDEAALRDLSELVRDEIALRKAHDEVERLSERLQDEIRRDDLTGLHNRRHWREQVPVELARAARGSFPVTVIAFDLDGFKAVNDTQGHAEGDRLLRAVADAWTAIVRAPDIVARMGGDEFAVLLVEADAEAARTVARRLAEAVATEVSVSYGIAQSNGDQDADTLLARADAELLRAKDERYGTDGARGRGALDPPDTLNP
jgi:diguanylate cyclase (GGDEF)-like protein